MYYNSIKSKLNMTSIILIKETWGTKKKINKTQNKYNNFPSVISIFFCNSGSYEDNNNMNIYIASLMKFVLF